MQILNELMPLLLLLAGGVICLLVCSDNRNSGRTNMLPKDPLAGLIADQEVEGNEF